MRKLIDQNGRLFGRISIIDVIVLLAVCVLAVALVVKENTLSPATQTGTAAVTVTYTLFINDLEDELLDGIQIGDQLYDHDQTTNGNIGTIVDIQASTATRTVYLSDGTIGTAEVPTYSDVIVTVEGQCDIVDGHYRFNNVYELGVNANRNFYTLFAGFTASVISIG